MAILATCLAQRAGSARIRRGLGQRDFRIAPQRAQASANALGRRRAAIEQRQSFDPVAVDHGVRRNRIDPAQGKCLARRFEPCVAHLRCQPFARVPIDIRGGSMNALAFVGPYDFRDSPGFAGVRALRNQHA